MTTGTVTGTFEPATFGTVILRFEPAADVLVGDDLTVIPSTVNVASDADGDISVVLQATDDPDLSPTGWTWRCGGTAERGQKFDVSFNLAGGSTVDFADLVEVQSFVGMPNPFATNAVAFDGTSTTTALTPANFSFIRSAIEAKLKTSQTATERHAAIMAAIEEACGSGNPVTTTRTAARGVELPAGQWLISAPVEVRSVIGFTLEGKGFCELRADSPMSAVLDINGAAYSQFGGFTVTGTAGVQVDNAIYTYWDNAGSQRTNHANAYYDIVVRNLDYIVGIRVGKSGAGNQVDNDIFENIHIAGAWATGETSRYQYGMYVGDGVFANNLVHHGYHLVLGHNRYQMRVDATQMAVYGAGFDGAESDLFLAATGFCCFSGIRSENAERFLERSPTSAAANVTISDVLWSADSMNADGQWVKFAGGGLLKLDQVRCANPEVQPLIVLGSSTTPVRCEAVGLTIGGTPFTPAVEDCFTLSTNARVNVKGFVALGASGATSSIVDYESHPADVVGGTP